MQKTIAIIRPQSFAFARSIVLLLALTGVVLCTFSRAFAKEAPAVVGAIDGIVFEQGQYFLTGWTCQVGVADSLKVQIFADASAFDHPAGKFVTSGTANEPSSPQINRKYKSPLNGRHNFKISLSPKNLEEFGARPLYVHGIRAIKGVENTALEHSGKFLCPCPMLEGTFNKSQQRPNVFVTEKELKDFAKRASTPNTLSQAEFEKLANYVGEILASGKRWDVAYSGTDIFTYLHTYSIVESGGYAGESRTEKALNAELKLSPDDKPPEGAGLVASRLALYAALLKNGATPPPNSPAAEKAIALSKTILLTWARKGFRDQSGNIFHSPEQFSEGGKFDAKASADVGLQVSRGALYSVHAQDLLEGIDVLSNSEIGDLCHYHAKLANLVRVAMNGKTFGTIDGIECGCFDNHHASDLAFMLAEARLEGNEEKFFAVLYGGDRYYLVNVPWTLLLNKNIYGHPDKPMDCYKNVGNFYQNAHVELGEISDRFRGLPYQSIGYPMLSYQRLLDAAQVIRNAGLDPINYHGMLHKSLESVANYYSCFLANAGFEKTITASNCISCANWEQYQSKTATGVGQMVRAAFWYPESKPLQKIDADGKRWLLRKGTTNDVDAISFGIWHD